MRSKQAEAAKIRTDCGGLAVGTRGQKVHGLGVHPRHYGHGRDRLRSGDGALTTGHTGGAGLLLVGDVLREPQLCHDRADGVHPVGKQLKNEHYRGVEPVGHKNVVVVQSPGMTAFILRRTAAGPDLSFTVPGPNSLACCFLSQ